MRVLLIQPPMYHQKVQLSPNLGLACIAAVLDRMVLKYGSLMQQQRVCHMTQSLIESGLFDPI